MEASNNWVIAPSKSSTGRPIMANVLVSPCLLCPIAALHRAFECAGPKRDWCRRTALPAFPSVQWHHRLRPHHHGIDQEDLYVYDINPANISQYRYQGAWVDMENARNTSATKRSGDGLGSILHTPRSYHSHFDAVKQSLCGAHWLA